MPNLPIQYQQIPQRYPLLDFDQEQTLSRRWLEERDLRAQEILVMSNLRAVLKEAQKYVRLGLDLEDLTQQGLIGLIRATNEYDPSQGRRFLTYALWWIRSEINRFIEKNVALVHFSTTENRRRAQRGIRRALHEIKVRQPELDEDGRFELAAKMLDVPVSTARQAYRNLCKPVYLDDATSPGSDRTKLELLSEESDEKIVTGALVNKEYRNLILRVLGQLDDRKRFIIERRWLALEPMGLREIGDILGVSHERIRQIEKQAFGELRGLLKDKISGQDLN